MSNYKQIISEALRNVVSEPNYDYNIYEVTLCHRLAVHLENSGKFTGYLIDCEYDKDGQRIKRGKPTRKNPKGRRFRPDIVVHKRGTGENNNLIMIEAKKYPCCPEEKAAEKERLRHHASKRKYRHAFLVVFPKDNVKNDSVIEVQ